MCLFSYHNVASCPTSMIIMCSIVQSLLWIFIDSTAEELLIVIEGFAMLSLHHSMNFPSASDLYLWSSSEFLDFSGHTGLVISMRTVLPCDRISSGSESVA
jgi:hypothetical protein